MSRRLTTYAEDVLFDAQILEDQYGDDDCQWLVALSDWQLAVLLSLTRYAHWESRWINYDNFQEILWKVYELEHCLMAGCEVSELIAAIDNLSAKFTYNDQNIAEIVTQMIPLPGNGVTLQEYLDSFEGDDIAQYPWIYAVLTMLADILPSNMAEQYVLEDPAEFTLGILRSLAELITDILSVAFEGVSASADTGSAIADVAGPIVSGLDTVFSGVTAGALSLSAIIDLINLFTSGQEPDPDGDEGLRALLRVYNNIFVEQQAMSVTQTNTQTVNCGGCGGGGTCFIADESPAGTSIDQPPTTVDPGEDQSPPDGFDDWDDSEPGAGDGYLSYKCKAANAMTLGFAERLFNIYEYCKKNYSGYTTHASTARAIEQMLRSFDEATIAVLGSTCYLAPPVFTDNVDNPVLVMARSYLAQKITDYIYPTPQPEPFQIFYDLRLGWLTDQQERICDLFNSNTTGDAKDAILGAVDDYFSGYSYSAEVKAWARGIIESMLVNYWLNLLFVKNDFVAGSSSEYDCDGCESCWQILITDDIAGDFLGRRINPVYGQEYELDSWFNGSYHYIEFRWPGPGLGCGCELFHFKIIERDLNGSDYGSCISTCPYETWDDLPDDGVLTDACHIGIIRGAASSITIQFLGWEAND